MRKRQPRFPNGLPRLWMMSDERMGGDFLPALARMPRGSGLIFRHHATPAKERRRLFDQAQRICRARRMRILLAGSPQMAMAWRADGVHGRDGKRVTRPLLRTAPVHDPGERLVAEASGAALIFLSPVYATRSHPGAGPMRRASLARLSRMARVPAIALGGMTSKRFNRLKIKNIIGWAAIDALSNSG